MIGNTTSEQTKQLRNWRKSEAPAWLPKSQSVMGDDTAAILASIGLQPRNWKDVFITANGDGSYTMTVTSKRSQRVRRVILPDRDSVLEVRNLFNANARRELAPSKKEAMRLDRAWANASGQAWEIGFSIGYGVAVSTTANTVPTKTVGTALPRKKAK